MPKFDDLVQDATTRHVIVYGAVPWLVTATMDGSVPEIDTHVDMPRIDRLQHPDVVAEIESAHLSSLIPIVVIEEDHVRVGTIETTVQTDLHSEFAQHLAHATLVPLLFAEVAEMVAKYKDSGSRPEMVTYLTVNAINRSLVLEAIGLNDEHPDLPFACINQFDDLDLSECPELDNALKAAPEGKLPVLIYLPGVVRVIHFPMPVV